MIIAGLPSKSALPQLHGKGVRTQKLRGKQGQKQGN